MMFYTHTIYHAAFLSFKQSAIIKYHIISNGLVAIIHTVAITIGSSHVAHKPL